MNYYWKEEEFITGDKIESIGEFIFDIDNFLTGDHGRIKTSKTEQELINEQITIINTQKPSIIHCYGHDTHRLLKNINNINHQFKLITHNSDIGIFKEYEPLANDNRILKWYGQNNYINHPKTVSLPIAIARKKYPHGNTALLSMFSKNTIKKNLVYKNFSIETNLHERTVVNDITTKNGITMSQHCNHTEYLKNISESIFVISPPGNGVDCHRIWECLYLKTIPVVQAHITFKQFEHLPILFINSWDEVTLPMLNSKIEMLNCFANKLTELSFEHLKKNILTLI